MSKEQETKWKALNVGVSDSSTRVRFEEAGDYVEGKLVEVLTLKSRDGDTFNKYVILDGEEKKSFLGSYVLDSTLPKVAIGTKVRVAFQGLQKIGGGKSVKTFEVCVEEVAPVLSA